MNIDEGLISLTADGVSVRDVIEEIAAQAGLRVVQHVVLDRVITLDVHRQPLPDVLDAILTRDSYQLFQPVDDADPTTDAIPGTLWIFSEGPSLASAATVFFEAVILYGSFDEKKEAIRELRRLGSPAAVEALSLALSDEDARVRDAAYEALAKIGSDAALAAIASTTFDTDPWIRSEAVDALSYGDNESAIQYLSLAFSDPDPRVRMSVVEAFADIPGEQAVTLLSRALRDEDPAVRMHAVEALEEIGDANAFKALIQAHRDDVDEIVEAVDETLNSMQPRD